MKIVQIKAVMMGLGTLVLGLGLTGCIEFTQPLCTQANLEDIPGLEGEHASNILDSEFKLSTRQVTVTHEAKGSYMNGQLVTCKLGKAYIAQSKTPFNTYAVSVVNSSDSGLSLATLIMGINQLQDLGMEYEIVERETNASLKAWGKAAKLDLKDQQKSKVMVIDNSQPDARALIEKFAVPLAGGFIFN